MKQTIKIGITVLVVAALAMSGIALAQSTDDTDADADQVARGVEVIMEKLGPLVEDGTITEAQAEAVAETLAESRPGNRPHRGPGKGLAEAAEFLGLEVEDLAQQLRDGATLAEIAGDQTDELIALMVDAVEEKLAEAVANERLTQEEADEKLAEAEERITTFVNEGLPERPEGEGRGGGRRGLGGPGEAPEGAETSA
jgi:3-hydroxyacyl-CoA dehydrogenase